nr:MMPL family transporter [Actinomycetota bacterium]
IPGQPGDYAPFVGPICSQDGKAAIVTAYLRGDGEADKVLDPVQFWRDTVSDPGGGLDVKITGGAGYAADAIEVFEGINGTLLLAAVSLVIVLLILIYRSPIFLFVPLAAVIFAEMLARSAGYGLSELGVTINGQSSSIMSILVLGAGTDYALLLVSRYREELRKHEDKHEAMALALRTAGPAILASGLTVMAALLALTLAEVNGTSGLGPIGAMGIGVALLVMLTFLPALLTIVGHRIDRLRIPGLGKRGASEGEGGRWFRWSRAIQRRPVLAALISGGLLLLLCVPTLSLRLGINDAGTEPAGKTTRQAYDLLAEGFGSGFNGPLVIAAALPQKGDDSGVKELRNALNADAGVAGTTPVVLNPAKDTAVFQVYPTTSPQSAKTTELLDRIRGDLIPPIEAETDMEVHVGGINAIFEDFGKAIAEKLPLFIGVVVLLSALLLMIVFRSILVPLKAMAMNLLSIGAAFGLVVAVFQWGWGAELIGVDQTGPIISFFPIFLFAIIFGLSMDYEVFLMSRVHEEWEHRKDASEAVTRGLALTGRVITAAAAIMVTVFLSFMIGDDRIIKLFGFGLAAAVFIDAVIIRSVLVPAVMQLLGPRAWSFPAWLDRLLPRLHVEPSEDDSGPADQQKLSPQPAAAESDG